MQGYLWQGENVEQRFKREIKQQFETIGMVAGQGERCRN